MYANFLVPFDGSCSSFRAVEAAIEMGCSGSNIDITVLQVRRMTDPECSTFDVASKLASWAFTAGGGQGTIKDEKARAYVQEYFDGLPDNVDFKIEIRRGSPADVICQYAHDNDIDCIVMGRRGLGGIRAVLGSVSTAVLRDSDLPVLVVK